MYMYIYKYIFLQNIKIEDENNSSSKLQKGYFNIYIYRGGRILPDIT